jgi:hypothetical protein
VATNLINKCRLLYDIRDDYGRICKIRAFRVCYRDSINKTCGLLL